MKKCIRKIKILVSILVIACIISISLNNVKTCNAYVLSSVRNYNIASHPKDLWFFISYNFSSLVSNYSNPYLVEEGIATWNRERYHRMGILHQLPVDIVLFLLSYYEIEEKLIL